MRSRKRKAQRAAAIAILVAVEIIASLLIGFIAYAILAPLALEERGYFAVGGEIVVAYLAAAGTFFALNRYFRRQRGVTNTWKR